MVKLTRNRRLAALATAGLIALSPFAAQAQKEIKIGVIFDFSGPFAAAPIKTGIEVLTAVIGRAALGISSM